ncbi:MAG: hypothetical protein ACK4FB_08845 [Brevundimonas sp.]|uniref:hypothetical protein n=1 Tax=Brevundimonas sp. TaxID=1871086 RepID=UPI00391B358E
MPPRPSAPANLRNGLKWRDGRPRWEPSPANRAMGFAGLDLRAADGAWMDRGAAIAAADARNLWAALVRLAARDDDEGGKARRDLRAALNQLSPVPADPHARRLVADLIERGRAVLENREPDVTAALARGPRTVQAMIDGFFADRRAMTRIAAATQEAYRVHSKKLAARFGALQVSEITPGKLKAWHDDLVDQISLSTANAALGAAGAMFRWACWQDPPWIERSPYDKLDLPSPDGRIVFWELDEELAFIPWCDANGYPDVADGLTLGLWSGARPIDMCAADLHELASATWRYVPTKTRRKSQEALPGLLQPVRDRVARRTAEVAADPSLRYLNAAPYLWDPVGRRRHTTRSLRYRYNAALEAALKARAVPETLTDKRVQDTRDTCVTRLYDAGVSLTRICSWGGWSEKSRDTILRNHYLHLRETGAIEDAEKLRQWAGRQGLALSA